MTDPIITSTNTGNRRTMSSPQQTASRTNPGQVDHTAGHLSSYGTVRSGMNQLRQGDIVRGEISDLRNNEITVTLENNTIIKGQIADSSSLSIGQTAAFRMSAVSSSGIVLDVIPNSYTESELTLINKALEEASLPATERNQSAVKALMDQLLPINRQSIQQLMQQAYDLGTEDMETLCLMNRSQYEVTADSVAQFSAYRNQTHQLLTRAETFSAQLPQLLNALAGNSSPSMVASFGETLLDIVLSPASSQNTAPMSSAAQPSSFAAQPMPTISSLPDTAQESLRSLLSQTPMTQEQLVQLQDGSLSQKDAALLVQKALSEHTAVLSTYCPSPEMADKSQEILQLLQPSASTPSDPSALVTLQAQAEANAADLKDNANVSVQSDAADGTAEVSADARSDTPSAENTAQETANDASGTSALSRASRLFHNLSDAARSSLHNMNQMLTTPQSTSASVTHLPAVVDTLLRSLAEYGREQNPLFSFLTAGERGALANAMQKMGLDAETAARVSSGDLSARETLSRIRNAISLGNHTAAQTLFQSAAFQKLLSHVMLENLTITPRQLAQNGEIDSFYHTMEQQMDSLENLIQSSLSGEDSRQFSGQAHDMKENIDFMKMLNETFQYAQLPLKLQNQNAHGDLYVYTKKEALRQNPEQITLLLHLEMEHLGTVNIHLKKEQQNITANFALEQEDALHLIERNTHLLQDSLAEKGYLCEIHVQPLTEPETPVQDFLNTKVTPSASHEMKRFSFDIRA